MTTVAANDGEVRINPAIGLPYIWDDEEQRAVYPTLVDQRDGMMLAVKTGGTFILTEEIFEIARFIEEGRALIGQECEWVSATEKYQEALGKWLTVQQAADAAQAADQAADRPETEAEAEITRLKAELARVRERNDTLIRQREKTLKEVGEVAMRYARENNWCDVVKEALDELGVPIPVMRRRFVVRAEWVIEADSEKDVRDSYTVEQSLTISEPDLDEDWENVDAIDERVEVLEVDVVE